MTGYGRGQAAGLREWAHQAIAQHEAAGTLPTSLRHLFYEAVTARVVAKGALTAGGGGRRPDQDLTREVTWLREQGLVAWDAIEDRTRHLLDHVGLGPDVAAGIDAVLDSVRVDLWPDDALPVLVVESESAAGVLDRIAFMYRVPIVPTRGQANGWLRTVVAGRLADRKIDVGYVGDFDKAGVDIEQNTANVLADVCDVIDWERLALTDAQVEQHGLTRLPRLDKRSGLTYLVCEVEALPQALLNRAVVGWLEARLAVDLDQVHEREEAERADVRARLGL